VIKTRVAQILSTTQLVLAAGSEDGVREGMEFVVYALGRQISDPETGQSLGQLEMVKGRVKVSYVQEKMCQATAIHRTVTETIDPIAFTGMQMFQPRQVKRTVYDELKVEGALPVDADLTVRQGDYAHSVE
jgi:hypothetical protein